MMTKYLLSLLLFCGSTPVFAQDDCPPGHVRHPAISALDDASMLAAYRASFVGIFHREPSMVPGAGVDDGGYYIRQSNHFGVYGDDQCHAGWSGYWESWLRVGHGDLSLVQTPAQFQPQVTPPPVQPPIPPVPPPPLPTEGVLLAELTAVRLDIANLARVDIANLRADMDAGFARADAFFEQVSTWKRDLTVFVAKYVLPELATLFATWKLAKP